MAPQGHELEISFIRDGQATREGELLHTLARSRGRPLHRDPLFKTVWGYNSELAGHLLAVHVRRLRRKIERDPETLASLHTVRGYGYKLDWGD